MAAVERSSLTLMARLRCIPLPHIFYFAGQKLMGGRVKNEDRASHSSVPWRRGNLCLATSGICWGWRWRWALSLALTYFTQAGQERRVQKMSHVRTTCCCRRCSDEQPRVEQRKCSGCSGSCWWRQACPRWTVWPQGQQGAGESCRHFLQQAAHVLQRARQADDVVARQQQRRHLGQLLHSPPLRVGDHLQQHGHVTLASQYLFCVFGFKKEKSEQCAMMNNS